MSVHTFGEQEILAALDVVGAPSPLVERIKQRLDFIKTTRNIAADPENQFFIASGYGHRTQQGHVTLEVDHVRYQMTPKKAKEIADMLLTAAEAAISDEIVMKLLRKVGITDPTRLGTILLDLRELRQGTRDNPS